MNTIRFTKIITAAFSLAALVTTGCAEKAKTDETALPSVTDQAATTVSPSDTGTRWIDLKDHTYDSRAQFFAGLKQLEARVDRQIAELTAKRAAMPSTANTKDWDFTMKEMVNSRSYLKSMGEVLAKATPETWNQEKDKVGLAWVRTQEAYAKVKASTTS